MTARSSRFVTALLLLFAAFGIPASTFGAARFGQAVIVCVSERRPAPSVFAERTKTPAVPAVMAPRALPQDRRPRDFFLRAALFQRPPPALPILLA